MAERKRERTCMHLGMHSVKSVRVCKYTYARVMTATGVLKCMVYCIIQLYTTTTAAAAAQRCTLYSILVVNRAKPSVGGGGGVN